MIIFFKIGMTASMSGKGRAYDGQKS